MERMSWQVQAPMLKGKVAIITGSTSGMGEAAAYLFAEHGARVVVTGRRENKGQAIVSKIKKMKGQAIFVRLDVSDESSVKAMIKEVMNKWGRIDVLYNNAGIESQGTIKDMTNEQWNKVFNVNIKGMMYCCKHATPKMKKGSSIINTASVAGLVGYANLSVYGATKGAVISLTRDLAVELGPRGIRANCICPGVIWTDMVKRFVKMSPDPATTKKQLIKGLPLNRVGQPREVAELALFLASDKSSFMTGAIIPIDGGHTTQ